MRITLHFFLSLNLDIVLRKLTPGPPVVQKVDNAIHRINHYPVDSAIGFPNTYPLDSGVSGGLRYPQYKSLSSG